MSSKIDELKAAHEHLEMALDHHAEHNHSAVKRRIELARGCVQRALDDAHEAAINPTAAQGAQVSDGQSPRDYSSEAVRQRDQRRGVDLLQRPPGPDGNQAMSQRLYAGTLQQLSEDEVAGTCISAGVKRDGDAWEPTGVDLSAYRRNPVVLREHDPNHVIGTAVAIGLTSDGSAIGIKIQFAPAGSSHRADEARQLAKAGILRGISAGIDILEAEPLGGGKYGRLILRSELLEVSLVAIPADQEALVTARSFQSRPATMAMLRSLPEISHAARERALERMRMPAVEERPVGLMKPWELAVLHAEHQRSRTMTAWAAGQANDAEDRARRRAKLEELEAIGQSYDATRQ